MILERRTRGQPLLALVLVLGGWVGARAVAWEHAIDEVAAERESGPHLVDAAQAAGSGRPAPFAQGRKSTGVEAGTALAPPLRPGIMAPPAALPLAAPAPLAPPLLAARPSLMEPLAPDPALTAPQQQEPAAPSARGDASQRILNAAGHQSLWLAATALMPLPPLGLRTPSEDRIPGTPPPRAGSRWSGDGWLLWRRQDFTIAPGPRVGTYGASQVGAVIRYRLDPADGHRTSLYVRGSAALNKTREQQAALGLSARPLGRVPLVAMAEGRLVRDIAGVRLRPAVAVVTELPPVGLPMGFTGEAYVQGGWVGGRRPTGFIDGLVRAERPVAQPADGFSLKAGAGAWAAKQRGASRVDVGPVASLTLRLSGTASARMEADWRFRVAGRSKPDSGPALTLSAGF